MFMRWRPIDEAHKEGITIWSDVSISNTFSFRSSTATSYRVLRIVFYAAFFKALFVGIAIAFGFDKGVCLKSFLVSYNHLQP